eukprot:8643868-Karenia_brevis.AAC.1
MLIDSICFSSLQCANSGIMFGPGAVASADGCPENIPMDGNVTKYVRICDVTLEDFMRNILGSM